MQASIILYHGLAQTGRVEWSGTSDTGPWTEYWLTAPTPLAEVAEFSFASGALFCDEGRIPMLEHTGTDYWVRANQTFWELWGMADFADVNGVIAVTATLIGVDPLGIITRQEHGVEIGTSFPLDVESVEASEYRAGRVSTVRFGRVLELDVTFLVPAEAWDAYEDSPMLMGHCAMQIQFSDSDPTLRSESLLDGAFACYPIETVEVLNESPDDVVVVKLRATMEDPA